MPSYEILWASFSDRNRILGELPVTDFEYSDTLNAPGDINGTITLNPYDLPDLFNQENFREADTVLYVLRDGVCMWGGLLWGWRANVNSDTLAFVGEGWHSYIRRRLITRTIQAAAMNQAAIAELILTTTMDDADPLGLAFNLDDSAGPDRDRTYYWWEGKKAGEAIEQLAAVQDGFDFRYVTTRNPTTGGFDITFTTMYPTTGRETNHVFELGTNVSFVNYSSDGKGITTRWVGFGSGQGADTINTAAYDPGSFTTDGVSRSYQLFDDTASFPDILLADTLDEHVNRLLAQSTTPNRLIVLNHYPGTEPQLGSYEIGDQCLVTANRGFVQINKELWRIVERRVSVDASGGEQVQITLAPIGVF